MLTQFVVNLREANLEKVPGLDGIKIVDIAAGAEHSAVVTGKILFSSSSVILF